MNLFFKTTLKSLIKNPSALLGLAIIGLALLLSVFSYLVMPDNSNNANNGMLAIRKQAPGFSCKVLESTKNKETEEQSFLSTFFNGKTPTTKSIPIATYFFDEKGYIHYTLFGSGKKQESTPAINIVDALESESSWSLDGSTISYKNHKGEKKSITYTEAKDLIEQSHIQTRTFIMGTDGAGRDLWSRIILGSRISLSIGFVAVLISLSIGTFLGAIAGYFQGKIDHVIMWFTTVFWSIPGIMLVIAISMALQSKGIWVTFLAVGLTTWVETARIVRGQVMEMREKQFIEAAQALGFSDARIIFKHILPNITGPLIVVATSNFASAILIEAGLSFLGLGVQPPTPSWGMMVHEGYTLLTSADSWGLIFFPSLCISLLVLAFNLFGNALRDIYDPRNTAK